MKPQKQELGLSPQNHIPCAMTASLPASPAHPWYGLGSGPVIVGQLCIPGTICLFVKIEAALQ